MELWRLAGRLLSLKSKIQPIGPPDSHHLSAASGWLELGNPREALTELERLSEEHRKHPDALELTWAALVSQRKWTDSLAVALQLLRIAPDRESSWLHQAYSVRRVKGGGVSKAEAILKTAESKFPKHYLIHYNLACYAAQLGHLEEAWDRLQLAMEHLGDAAHIKTMALADNDLAELWPRIREMETG